MKYKKMDQFSLKIDPKHFASTLYYHVIDIFFSKFKKILKPTISSTKSAKYNFIQVNNRKQC